MSTSTARHDAIDRAAAHVHAAANLLDGADTSEALFSPARILAAQLSLVAAGLSADPPPIVLASWKAASPAEHLDQALAELDRAISLDAPAELLVWTARLRDLRPQLAALATRR